MSDTVPTRVHFFEHQFLRAVDFIAEQAYHLQGLRRHNLAGHHWGIVHGLEVVLDEGGNISVQAGLAVDGYGRVLIRPVYHSVSKNAFDDQNSDTLEIWLLYDRRSGEAAPNGYARCDDDRQIYREVETARIEARAPDPNQVSIGGTERPDGRRPLDVIPADLNFGPQRTPPDDPSLLWPVYLGQVRRDDTGELQVDLEGRPYAGLVGEFIRSPSGEAFLQVGAEWPGDSNRFAVYLDTGNELIPPPGTQPELAINDQGEITIYHDTTLYGDLTIDGGAMVLNRGPLYNAAQPWRIYHTEAPSPAQAGITVEQLRVEMAPAGSPAEVVIGHWSAQQKEFVPCLTIDNNCTVTVHGDLEIQGNMTVTGQIFNVQQTVQALVSTMVQEVSQGPKNKWPVLNALVAAIRHESELYGVLSGLLLENDLGEIFSTLIDARPDASEFYPTGEEVAGAEETDAAVVTKEQVDAPLAPAVPDDAGKDQQPEVQENFIAIEGIGRVYAKRLEDAGIRTFAALADLKDKDLDAIIQPSRYHNPDYPAWRSEAAARSAAAAESTGTTSSEGETTSEENEA